MRKLIILTALALSGCATQPPIWVRADHDTTRYDPDQLARVQAICRGQMQAAGLAGSNRENGFILTPSGFGTERGQAMNDVFAGCMAQQGYVRLQAN